MPWRQYLEALTDLLVHDGFEGVQASEIARKILDYERNVAYQRELFVNLKDGRPLQYETPPSVIADIAVASRLDRTKDDKREPIFEEKLDRDIAKFFRTIARRDVQQVHAEAVKVLRKGDHHLRRSANQLIKSLRSA